jgi:hypothetical protein
LSDLLPNLDLEILNSDPFFKLARAGPSGEANELSNLLIALSSGEAESLTVCLDVLTIAVLWELEGSRQRLVLIDEPDTHLHPELQVRLARVLADRNATHHERIRAAAEVLDRAGYPRRMEVDVEAARETLMERLSEMQSSEGAVN